MKKAGNLPAISLAIIKEFVVNRIEIIKLKGVHLGRSQV